MQSRLSIYVLNEWYDERIFALFILGDVYEVLEELKVARDEVQDGLAVGEHIEAHNLRGVLNEWRFQGLGRSLQGRRLTQLLKQLDLTPHYEREWHLDPETLSV